MAKLCCGIHSCGKPPAEADGMAFTIRVPKYLFYRAHLFRDRTRIRQIQQLSRKKAPADQSSRSASSSHPYRVNRPVATGPLLFAHSAVLSTLPVLFSPSLALPSHASTAHLSENPHCLLALPIRVVSLITPYPV